MVVVPNLQVQFTWQLFLDLAGGKDGYLSAYDHNALAFAVHNSKHKAPVEIPFPRQRIVMDVGPLIIVIKNPAGIDRAIFIELLPLRTRNRL